MLDPVNINLVYKRNITYYLFVYSVPQLNENQYCIIWDNYESILIYEKGYYRDTILTKLGIINV